MLTLSSQTYGMATACSTIILLIAAHCLLRSSPVASAAFVIASSICLLSSRLQFTLPCGLMAAPLKVGSSIDCGSVKSLNQPTFGQMTYLDFGTPQNFVYSVSC